MEESYTSEHISPSFSRTMQPRNKGEISIAVIIVLVIAFLAIGFYAGTFFGGTTATSTPTGVATSGMPADTEGWVIDTRADTGFRIAHPGEYGADDNTTLAASQDWRVNADGVSGVKALSIIVPGSFQPGTNFSNATLTVGYGASQAAQTGCLTPDPSGGPATATTSLNVNGTPFQVFSSQDAGAGNLYHTVSYRALHGGKCYAIEYTIHSTQLANYPAGTVTAFDEAKVEALMQKMVNTFAFL